MPYIKDTRRLLYDDTIAELLSILTEAALSYGVGTCIDGDINYIITRILKEMVVDIDGMSYYSLERAVGCLEMVKLELYRRLAAPYEDMKKEDNGDVYL